MEMFVGRWEQDQIQLPQMEKRRKTDLGQAQVFERAAPQLTVLFSTGPETSRCVPSKSVLGSVDPNGAFGSCGGPDHLASVQGRQKGVGVD